MLGTPRWGVPGKPGAEPRSGGCGARQAAQRRDAGSPGGATPAKQTCEILAGRSLPSNRDGIVQGAVTGPVHADYDVSVRWDAGEVGHVDRDDAGVQSAGEGLQLDVERAFFVADIEVGDDVRSRAGAGCGFDELALYDVYTSRGLNFGF